MSTALLELCRKLDKNLFIGSPIFDLQDLMTRLVYLKLTNCIGAIFPFLLRIFRRMLYVKLKY
jgi:hypothetical protein